MDQDTAADDRRFSSLHDEIAFVAGNDAAMAILAARGGQCVIFASHLRDSNWLVQTVGREKAELLSAHFTSGRGQLRLDLPVDPLGKYSAAQRERAAIITQAIAEGASENEIARRAGLSRRSVQRFKHKARRAASMEKVS